MNENPLKYGPYEFTAETIDEAVEPRIGAYALLAKTKRGYGVVRIGRSDNDLNARLKDYLSDTRYQRCTHFVFEYLRSMKAAFEKECRLYHDFRPQFNDYHPARPEGANYCCPVGGDLECLTCDPYEE